MEPLKRNGCGDLLTMEVGILDKEMDILNRKKCLTILECEIYKFKSFKLINVLKNIFSNIPSLLSGVFLKHH